MTSTENHRLLGVPAHASREEILEARRRLSLVHHPDRGGDSALMARINGAADELLSSVGEHAGLPVDVAPDPVGGRGRLAVDRPSFTIDALPVVAHEVLAVAVASIGEVVDDDPPYVVEFVIPDARDGRLWCRAEIVPDAGSSTVSLISELSRPDQLDLVRDLIVREINSIGMRD